MEKDSPHPAPRSSSQGWLGNQHDTFSHIVDHDDHGDHEDLDYHDVDHENFAVATAAADDNADIDTFFFKFLVMMILMLLLMKQQC